jgi:predicted nucleic acid-binding protein
MTASVDGGARICTSVPALVDTNVLVYRFDSRFPDKQRLATDLLRGGIERGTLRVPQQALIEFVAVTTRRLRGNPPLLSLAEATEEAEAMLVQFEILYPDEEVFRLALRGAAAYRLSWFDAHLWAYAERNGCDELLSEDFQSGRLYGSVRVTNPFDA